MWSPAKTCLPALPPSLWPQAGLLRPRARFPAGFRWASDDITEAMDPGDYLDWIKGGTAVTGVETAATMENAIALPPTAMPGSSVSRKFADTHQFSVTTNVNGD